MWPPSIDTGGVRTIGLGLPRGDLIQRAARLGGRLGPIAADRAFDQPFEAVDAVARVGQFGNEVFEAGLDPDHALSQ